MPRRPERRRSRACIDAPYPRVPLRDSPLLAGHRCRLPFVTARRLRCAAPAPPASRHDPAREKRLEWFREAKYGLFIHWGLYAIPAGEWKGKRSLGLGEWIMNRAQIPVKEYEQLATQFNPVKFDADAWVQLAKDAGMKYIVITSKHHDGFALFKSKVSTYNVVDATPFKRDVLEGAGRRLREARHAARLLLLAVAGLARAERRRQHLGLRPPTSKKDYDEYLRGKAEPQVRELLTGYGPVALIWFDTPRMMTGERAAALHRHRARRCSRTR